MQPQELRLLDGVIDALDDLFDRKTTVAAVHRIIFATCEAMKGSEFAEIAQPVLPELLKIINSNDTPEQKRDLALGATDNLRLFIAPLVPPLPSAAIETRTPVGVLVIRLAFICAMVVIVLAVLVGRLVNFLNVAKE